MGRSERRYLENSQGLDSWCVVYLLYKVDFTQYNSVRRAVIGGSGRRGNTFTFKSTSNDYNTLWGV